MLIILRKPEGEGDFPQHDKEDLQKIHSWQPTPQQRSLFTPKIRKKTGILTLPLLFNIVLEVLASQSN